MERPDLLIGFMYGLIVAGGLVAAYCAGWHSTNPHK